jgi:hypothetical protein
VCRKDCQCIICEMERQGALESEEEEKPVALFEEFVKSGLGS